MTDEPQVEETEAEPEVEPEPEAEGYESMKVDELRAELESRSLSIGGNKSDLIARLEEDDASEEEAQVTYVLVDEYNGEPVNQAEFGHPETGERVELKPGESITVGASKAVELASMPFLKEADE